MTGGDAAASFTTVMNWASFDECVHQGQVYGQKSREFAPYFDLPRRAELPMEMAVNAPSDVVRRLREGGWSFADANVVTRDPWAYQKYLAHSRAEFCVAKHGYVVTRCGWFSDRSSAYLASGRPVVVQDTGFSDVLPTGEGLLCFRTPAEASAALRRVNEDYERHSRAARTLVEEFFDARNVLGDLLEKSLA